jgi:hypothetical protein
LTSAEAATAAENPKLEIRNPKQIPMTKDGNSKLQPPICGRQFEHLEFEIRICFGFRISDFVLGKAGGA